MGVAKLGNMSFRIDPSQIGYVSQVDNVVIDTLGGQVVQILGVTIGDITISGMLGEDRPNKIASWELAQSFHAQIKAMIDAQTLPPKKNVNSPSHQPIRFTFSDGIHNWDMQVLIKGISDLDGNGALSHSNGKFSYGYTLTLFLVKDSSESLKKVAKDAFIERIAKGVGWSKNPYNGSLTTGQAQDFLASQSPIDPSIQGYLTAALTAGAADIANADNTGG